MVKAKRACPLLGWPRRRSLAFARAGVVADIGICFPLTTICVSHEGGRLNIYSFWPYIKSVESPAKHFGISSIIREAFQTIALYYGCALAKLQRWH